MTFSFTAQTISVRPLAAALDLQATSLVRLSTGVRINRAADDPAGMFVASGIRAVLRVLDAESRALERADAYASTADAALGEVGAMLDDADALALQAANTSGMTDAERDALQNELDSIVEGVNRVGRTTTFASTPIFDGDGAVSTGDATQTIDQLDADSLGAVEVDGRTYTLADVASGGDADLASDPELASRVIAAARDDAASRRGDIGAFQARAIAPRLSLTSGAARELSGALSIIAGADYGAETANFARASVLAAGSVASLALASAITRGVLPLLTP